ncbi:DnaD domain-containing protein [Culicoidibacter larvae]|uniref:DnaD domain protein n=1 Tax=Culicoidibacter larvae TaxID=2579976 RepID=A0A5R8QEZ2_9FIRM|nr:DnaD domain protein [Culicoidibacter larvae]TLG76599.1 DnaD domain protein [Culicoidibacter larvae]
MFDMLFKKTIADNPNLVLNYVLQFERELELSDEETLVLLHLLRLNIKKNNFPSNSQLIAHMQMDEEQCRMSVLGLISKRLVEIDAIQKEDAIIERYRFDLLIERLALLQQRVFIAKQNAEKEASAGSIFQNVEEAFGRPLAPIELETVARWMNEDNYSEGLILEALDEAILNDVRNIRYMERILFEWQKQGVTSVEEAQRQRQHFRDHQQKNNPLPENEVQGAEADFFVYDWLKENK